jgi:multiple sugar transport system substrate-binding protein
VAQFSVISNAQEPSPTETLYRHVFFGVPPYMNGIHDINAQFKAETGIDAEVDEAYGDATPYTERVVLGYPYDVFSVNGEWLDEWVDAGYFRPLTGLIDDEADFYPSLMDMGTVDGVPYCIPKIALTVVLMYNRDVFDEAELAYPTNDWTWTEWLDASKALSDFRGEPAGMGFDHLLITFLSLLFQAGGTVFDADTGEFVMNSPEALDALTFYMELEKLGILGYQSDTEPSSPTDLLGTGQVGMILQHTWMLSYQVENYPDMNWGAVQIPSYRTENALILSDCYAVSAITPFPDESVSYANFLVRPDILTTYSETIIPGRMSMADNFVNYWVTQSDENGRAWQPDDVRVFVDVLNYGTVLRTKLNFMSLSRATFEEAMVQAFNGEISAQEVLNQLEEAVLSNNP